MESFDSIIGILDTSNNIVAKYKYDTWGNILSMLDGNDNDVSNNMSHIANINPFRYPFEVLVFPKIYPDMNIIIRYMINITIVLVFNPMRFKMLKIKGNIINNVIGYINVLRYFIILFKITTYLNVCGYYFIMQLFAALL